MRKIILYVAISLDGKIAKLDGDVKWLESIPNPDQLDYGYVAFNEKIDTTIMGNKTYEEILGFDVPFPYPDKKNYVLTRQAGKIDTEFVTFVSGDVLNFVKKLKTEKGKDIWLIGGSEVTTLFFNEDLVDELFIFVMPIVIGAGIPLFGDYPIERPLQLMETKAYPTGVTFLKYEEKNVI